LWWKWTWLQTYHWQSCPSRSWFGKQWSKSGMRECYAWVMRLALS
jgi:hypothetical protein